MTFCRLTADPFPFAPCVAISNMFLYLTALVRKYLEMRVCSDGEYFLVKLVTFWARIFKRFAMTYCPEFNDIEKYDIFRVAMIAKRIR